MARLQGIMAAIAVVLIEFSLIAGYIMLRWFRRALGMKPMPIPIPMGGGSVEMLRDDPGEAAARDCAWRWKRQGRRVRIAHPPQGMDFNDLLMGRAPRVEESTR